jgi:hypothetical protein
MILFAVAFALGDLTELFKNNVGVSAAKRNLVLAADVVSLVVGLTTCVLGIAAIAAARRTTRPSTLLISD